MKKFFAVFGLLALGTIFFVSLGTNFSTPLDAQEECWCCINGKVVLTVYEKCTEAGGTCYPTKEEALKNCGEQPTCWCCYQGKVFETTWEKCKEMGGICYPTKDEAYKNCVEQPTCWCCYQGKVFETTFEKCKEMGGVCYPTREEAEKNCREGGKLPDLVIDNIQVNRSCQVVVTVKNLGPGLVPDTVWTVHTPMSCAVYLYINGKKWGGATVWKFDPGRALQAPGGVATYTSKLTVNGIAAITAVIDHTHQVTEVNEGNNKMVKRLKCRL